MVQQQRPQSVPKPDYLIQEEDKPFREPLPKTFERVAEPERFEDIYPDYFWPIAKGAFALVVGLMGIIAVRDMWYDKYSWIVALSWTSTAIMGLAGIAFIDKNRAK